MHQFKGNGAREHVYGVPTVCHDRNALLQSCTHSSALQSGWDVRSTRTDSLMTGSCSRRPGNNGTVPALVPGLKWFVCLQDLLLCLVTYQLKIHCRYTPSNYVYCHILLQLNFHCWCVHRFVLYFVRELTVFLNRIRPVMLWHFNIGAYRAFHNVLRDYKHL